MKLISCYIAAFGKFKEQSFTFDPNLNCILEDNGYGKSTLAAFLKAMLYGMGGFKKGVKDFPDRMHYYPAGAAKNSATYGGTLTFEKDGNEYRIERFFDYQTGSKDTLSVYKNGSPTDELGENPGVTLFCIDAESFERTVFFDGTSVGTGTTPDINRALNNVISDLKEDVTAEKAAKALDDAAKEIRGKQKGKGKAAELERELADARLKILNLRKIEGSLEEKYENAKKIKQSIAEHDLERKALDKYRETEGKIKVYEEKKRAVTELENKIKATEDKYPKGIPEKEITDSLRFCADAEKLADAQTRELFSSFSPCAEDFGKAEATAKEIADAEQKANEEKIRRSTLSREYETLKKRFESAAAADVMTVLTSLNEKRQNCNSEIKQAAEKPKQTQKASLGITGKIFGIVAIILCGLDFVKLLYVLISWGGSSVAWGIMGLLFELAAICGLVTLLCFLSNKKKKRKENEKLEALLAELTERRSKVESELRHTLDLFGYTNPNFDSAIASATADYNRYTEIKKQAEEFDLAIAECKKTANAAKFVIADFCAKLGINVSLTSADQILSNLAEAKKKYENYLRFKKAEAEAGELLSRFGLEKTTGLSDFANNIDIDRRNCSVYRSELQQKRNEAEDYMKKECPDGLPEKPDFDIEAFENKKNELSRELAKQEKEIEECETEISEIPVKEARVKELEREIMALDEEKDIYLTAAAEIRAADNRIKDKYIGPVRSKLISYMKEVDGIDENLISVDGNYAVSVDIGGALHDERYLSSGQKELLSFCQRLALADNVYKNEKPFLILDDPFASLDGTRIEKMTQLIKNLSNDRQILYFCCHDSRTIK